MKRRISDNLSLPDAEVGWPVHKAVLAASSRSGLAQGQEVEVKLGDRV